MATAADGVAPGTALEVAIPTSDDESWSGIKDDESDILVISEPAPPSVRPKSLNSESDDSHLEWRLLDWPHDLFAGCVCENEEYVLLDFDDFYDEFRDAYPMTEEEMRLYYSRLWMHRAQPLGWPLESAYLGHSTNLDSQRRGLAGVSYGGCSAEMLKHFVKQRSLPDPYPPGVTLKYCYIRLLEKDDRDLTFRFLDLPSEIRSMVYGALLTVPSSFWAGVKCSPAILRACRQVQQEAQDVLHDNNFVVKFELVQRPGNASTKTAEVFTEHTISACEPSKYYRIPDGIDDYPDFFRRIHRLELRLSYMVVDEHANNDDDALGLNHFVYTLASFLMEGHSLKHLQITRGFPAWQEERVLGAVLYPLRRVRNIAHVTFGGITRERMRKKLKADLTSNDAVFNTMRHWQLLSQQANTQLELGKLMGLSPCCCGECPDSEPIDDVVFSLSSLADCQQKCYWNSLYEQNSIARLTVLKEAVEYFDVAWIEKKLEALSAQRKALRRLEAVTDNGRLHEASTIWAEHLYDEDPDMMRSDHDWSDCEDMDEPNIQSKADSRQLLNKREVAEIIEAWEPDAASQLSRASSPSAYEPDSPPPTTPD